MAARRDEDVLVLVSVAADAPHSVLTPFLAQSYSNYPTYDYLLQTTDTAFQRKIITAMYQELIFPPMQEKATGVCILAVGRSCATLMGGLFIATRSFDAASAVHGLSDPAETYAKIWRDVWRAEPRKYPTGGAGGDGDDDGLLRRRNGARRRRRRDENHPRNAEDDAAWREDMNVLR